MTENIPESNIPEEIAEIAEIAETTEILKYNDLSEAEQKFYNHVADLSKMTLFQFFLQPLQEQDSIIRFMREHITTHRKSIIEVLQQQQKKHEESESDDGA